MELARSTLRDGTEIAIVQVRPEDREELREAFEHWSEESRFKRFMGFRKHLSDRELDYFTKVDHHDHEALLTRELASGRGIGIARFHRLSTRHDVAEAAVAVADEWQGRGVASTLLHALADRAREEGIAHFEATMLLENRRVVDLFEKLGPLQAEHVGDGEIEIQVALPADGGVGDGLAHALRAGAQQSKETDAIVVAPRVRS